MKPITFTNTNIKIDNWPKDLHLTHKQGYAYETDDHFLFLCGNNYPYIGWSIAERKQSQADLRLWCTDNFGAKDFHECEYKVGTSIKSVWRPGIYNAVDLHNALDFNEEDLARAGQALRILISQLDEILLFIEPDANFLRTYGHKTRNLLISACTEIENYFQYYMNLATAIPERGAYFTIKDYAKLQPVLFLNEYEIDMYAHPSVGKFCPFSGWSYSNHILPWYEAYNKTKHNRSGEFQHGSLINCIHAVGACLVLFSIRFGPTWWQSNFINSPIPDAYRLFRQPLYSGDPKKVYVPKIEPPTYHQNKTWGNLENWVKDWSVSPFTI